MTTDASGDTGDAPSKYVIVVAADDSDHGERALERAIEIAQARGDVELHAVSVVIGDSMGKLQYAAGAGRVSIQKERDAFDEHIDGVLARSRRPEWSRKRTVDDPAPSVTIERHVLVGPAVEEIIGIASKYDADLLVVGTRGRRGMSRLILGSVAEGVLRHAACPVLVVRPKHWKR